MKGIPCPSHALIFLIARTVVPFGRRKTSPLTLAEKPHAEGVRWQSFSQPSTDSLQKISPARPLGHENATDEKSDRKRSTSKV
jgi:hypothetical protein